MRSTTLLAAFLALPFSSVRAQTAVDTAAVDSALLAVVVRELRLGGDHQPPVRVPLRSDASWSGRLYAQLRARYPDFIDVDTTDTLSVRRPGLTVTVNVLDLQPTVAEASISWTRCTTRVAFLNFWTHESRVRLRKGITGWIVDSPRLLAIGDGHC